MSQTTKQRLIRVSTDSGEVVGPKGTFRTGKSMSFVLALLATGERVPVKDLVKFGTWRSPADMMTDMRHAERRLNSVGVDLLQKGLSTPQGTLRLRAS